MKNKTEVNNLKIGRKFKWRRKLWIRIDNAIFKPWAATLSTGEFRIFDGDELVTPVKVKITVK